MLQKNSKYVTNFYFLYSSFVAKIKNYFNVKPKFFKKWKIK